jgi:hypothetical protein
MSRATSGAFVFSQWANFFTFFLPVSVGEEIDETDLVIA